ncbi:MAG: tyrosine-type recombinase/integrase [Muribaculaceae bacterium]|nr:tyrosine-type recombinase/integrase [Muribaculaceae bacterium]
MGNNFREFEDYLRYELRRSPHTVRAYLSDVEELYGRLKTEKGNEAVVASASAAEIRRWLGEIARTKKSPASLKRRLQSVRSYFKFLCRHSILKVNPAADITPIKLPKKLPEFIQAEEMEQLLAELENTSDNVDISNSDTINPGVKNSTEELRDSLILELLYTTGMRRAELLGVSDIDIDFHACELKVLGKRRKQRVIPLDRGMLTKIQRWQKERDLLWPELSEPRPLIATRQGRMSESTLYRIVRRELQGVNTSRKSPHTLRHTFATAMLNGGSHINEVKEFLGHSSLATTQIYTHISFTELMKSYDRAHPRGDNHQEKNTSDEPK